MCVSTRQEEGDLSSLVCHKEDVAVNSRARAATTTANGVLNAAPMAAVRLWLFLFPFFYCRLKLCVLCWCCVLVLFCVVLYGVVLCCVVWCCVALCCWCWCCSWWLVRCKPRRLRCLSSTSCESSATKCCPSFSIKVRNRPIVFYLCCCVSDIRSQSVEQSRMDRTYSGFGWREGS